MFNNSFNRQKHSNTRIERSTTPSLYVAYVLGIKLPQKRNNIKIKSVMNAANSDFCCISSIKSTGFVHKYEHRFHKIS